MDLMFARLHSWSDIQIKPAGEAVYPWSELNRRRADTFGIQIGDFRRTALYSCMLLVVIHLSFRFVSSGATWAVILANHLKMRIQRRYYQQQNMFRVHEVLNTHLKGFKFQILLNELILHGPLVSPVSLVLALTNHTTRELVLQEKVQILTQNTLIIRCI